MDFNFSQNMIRNDSIFQTTGTEIVMSSERALKLVLRTLSGHLVGYSKYPTVM